MPIPAGITTALVHMDAPLSFIGDPGRVHITITPSVPLIWAATGTPIINFVDTVQPANGQEFEVYLPHTDQEGFLDGNGNAFEGWFYTVKIIYEKGGQRHVFPDRDFQILTGQTEVDLALVPAGEAYIPEIAPILPVTSIDGFNGAVTLEMLDLDLVDNTPDLEKPISTATQTALNLKAPINNPTFTGTVGGVSKAMVGLGNVDNTTDLGKPISTATQTALNAKAPLASPAFTGTPTGITKTHVGLSNVDNTSDINKPVSTPQATAINALIPKPNQWKLATDPPTVYTQGVTTFLGYPADGWGIYATVVTFRNLISTGGGTAQFMFPYLDDTLPLKWRVWEYDATVWGPWHTLATDAQVALKANLASPTFTGTVGGITKSMVGLGSVDNTADTAKPVSTAQQTALDAKADKVGTADVEITDTTKGVILKSPNGTRWRIKVADDGAITATSLS